MNNLIVGGTLFPHKTCHKDTLVSPEHQTENQIDHIIIKQSFRSSLQDVKVRRGADIVSDHHLEVCQNKNHIVRKKETK